MHFTQNRWLTRHEWEKFNMLHGTPFKLTRPSSNMWMNSIELTHLHLPRGSNPLNFTLLHAPFKSLYKGYLHIAQDVLDTTMQQCGPQIGTPKAPAKG